MTKPRDEKRNLLTEVFAYLDYRAYLRDVFGELKSRGPLSERGLARKLGFASPSYLKMILDGKRKLSQRYLPQLAKLLGLKRAELRFLEQLVAYADAPDAGTKALALLRLSESDRFREVRLLPPEHYAYFSRWYYVAIREALTGMWSQRPLSALAEGLGVSVAQVEEAASSLLKLGLLKRSSNPSGYEALEGSIKTRAEMRSPLVREFHKQMLHRALHALDHVPTERRDVSALTLNLSADSVNRLKEKLSEFRAEINAEFSSLKGARDVYQITIQFFPLIADSNSEVA